MLRDSLVTLEQSPRVRALLGDPCPAPCEDLTGLDGGEGLGVCGGWETSRGGVKGVGVVSLPKCVVGQAICLLR